MKRALSIIVLAAALTTQTQAQDIHFSQFYETTVLRNPALTGIFNGDYKVSANYRNQWNSIAQPFVTGQVSFETRIPVNDQVNDFFSAGLLAYQDKAGSVDMKTVGVYPVVSFSKSMEDVHNSFISAGFTAGYVQRSFDPTKVRVNSQYGPGGYNPDAPTGEHLSDSKINYFDLGAGINFSSGGGENNELSYFVGVAGFHFTKPRASFYNDDNVKLDTRWNVNAGLTYRIDESFGVIVQGNYTKQGGYSEAIAGGLFHWKSATERASDPNFVLYLGGFYRLNDAVVPVVKVDYMRYSIGFSYDVNVSELKAASNMRGGYELSVVKTGMFKDPKWERSRTACPHFFW